MHKIGLQFRNTSRPGCTDFCSLIGQIRRPKTTEGVKIDNFENCQQLLNHTDADDIFGLNSSLADQLYELENSCVVKIGDPGTHHFACLPLLNSKRPTFTDFCYSSTNSKVYLKDAFYIPSTCMKNQGASGCSLDASAVTSAAGKWMPINTDG